MKASARVLSTVAITLLPVALHADDAPSKAETAAASESGKALGDGRYFHAAEVLRPFAFDPAGKPKPGFAYQSWSEAEMLMTAERPTAPITATDPAGPSPVSGKTPTQLRTATAHDAIAEIVARAKKTRIVVLNEDHGVSRDRAFGLEVARALRPLGYDVLAVETLGNAPDDTKAKADMRYLAADGYPRQSTGYYSKDPVFGDFLRQSLALGYRPVAYETTDYTQYADADTDIAKREQAQADYIVARALKAYPASKLFIYVGFSHATEAPDSVTGKPRRWLATRLKAMTGIDPLTIDQTTIAENPSYAPRGTYPIVADRAKRRSIVLMTADEPLVVGQYAGLVDLQVVHLRTGHIGGRPDWLAAMGRKASPIPTALLPTRGTRLVQAFVAREAKDAIPVDQVLVTAGQTPPMLLLPKVPVRLAFQDASVPH